MKKIIVTITLSFIMCVMFLGSASAVSWSSSESLAIPSWGAMSNPTSASKNKTKKCSYGYIEKTLDNTAFGKYGDFYKGGRISKTYYQIYLNNQTKIHYTDANAKKTISSVKARVCGSNDYSLVIAPVVADLCTTPVALSAPPNSYQNNSQS
ncbi:hypothetical protein [Catenibacterium sp.]|uniref:hypothetical protein n=1 Tax=Catenibacterium sp. TaxID=2049022 RepID=UPI002E76A65D|nr:hypothetical protein [Catenibacterium sp.]MEE0042170.1 hypothetical protein [Catenibacterium sp.]